MSCRSTIWTRSRPSSGRATDHRLRIATKYHRLVREFLRDAGVADYRLVDSQGATEATVAHGTAEAMADITSTGETLRANHLKVLPDALILRSEATLWRSRRAEMTTTRRLRRRWRAALRDLVALRRAMRPRVHAGRLIRARRSRPARTASSCSGGRVAVLLARGPDPALRSRGASVVRGR
jgi:ATP phosphoribosyltransferase